MSMIPLIKYLKLLFQDFFYFSFKNIENQIKTNTLYLMIQKTIKKSISFSGTGLHTGNKIKITLKKAPEDHGIIFLYNNEKIPFNINHIAHTIRSITIGKKKKQIMTIEHLMASIYMEGITNLNIEIDHNEIPAMDGSAKQFLNIIKKCGIKTQKKKVPVLKITKPVQLIDKDKFIVALPSDQLKITYGVDFPHPELKNKTIYFQKITLPVFKKDIAPARTFGFEKEVNSLLKKGLALGGNLKNAVVLTENGYLNKKLRFKDECIRHKVLDFIGALAFINKPIRAHFIIYKSGHKFDLQFIKKLLKTI